MRLLDCGCGPGTITAGLAELVAPGEVVGIDAAPAHVARGDELARERGRPNLRFQVGDLAALPFSDGAFDAILASEMLQYQPEPPAGFRSLRRVLAPGGVLGVCDSDVSTLRMAPDTPFTRAFVPLFRRYREVGASPYYALQQRQLLRASGFVRTEAVTLTECLATPEETRVHGEAIVGMLTEHL
jgi:ubiquinone/menaquinone biosynthesis C-methylase UbiE